MFVGVGEARVGIGVGKIRVGWVMVGVVHHHRHHIFFYLSICVSQ